MSLDLGLPVGFHSLHERRRQRYIAQRSLAPCPLVSAHRKKERIWRVRSALSGCLWISTKDVATIG